jgi:hypothetical protein
MKVVVKEYLKDFFKQFSFVKSAFKELNPGYSVANPDIEMTINFRRTTRLIIKHRANFALGKRGE